MNEQQRLDIIKRMESRRLGDDFDSTEILEYASAIYYDLTLLSDDNGHWAIVDDNMSNVPGQDDEGYPAGRYVAQCEVENRDKWHDSPKKALIDYAKREGWLTE